MKTSKAQRREGRLAFADFADTPQESSHQGTLKRGATSKSIGRKATKKKLNKLVVPKPPKMQGTSKKTLKRNVSNNTRSSGGTRDGSLQYRPQTLKSIAWASSRNLLLSDAANGSQRQLPSFTKVSAPRAGNRSSKSPVIWPYGKGARANS